MRKWLRPIFLKTVPRIFNGIFFFVKSYISVKNYDNGKVFLHFFSILNENFSTNELKDKFLFDLVILNYFIVDPESCRPEKSKKPIRKNYFANEKFQLLTTMKNLRQFLNKIQSLTYFLN